jgi:4-amino-4-deoxychorismate lyase
VWYRKQIEAIELVPYSIRPVRALQMVHINDTFLYDHKYADREKLQALFAARTFGDDILLVRNGLLTDTSYANVALFDGSNWYTPLQPLLAGTARARLLHEEYLKEADIHLDDLSAFQQIRLINAMMDWEKAPVISMDQLQY